MGQTVVEIVHDVLTQTLNPYERTIDTASFRQGDYEKPDYCAQFRESTFAFCNRILEEKGIAYGASRTSKRVHTREAARRLERHTTTVLIGSRSAARMGDPRAHGGSVSGVPSPPMPEFVTVPDPVAGAAATGRIRVDRRPSGTASSHPVLVLIGGMTQTLQSWGGQIRPLAAHREVLAYEARGQGTTELDVTNCSPARHVIDFVNLVAALSLPTPLDLCGFSFGGRTALAIAATRPELVRRLVISGVAHERGIVGRLIVEGWIAALRTGDLEALARISLPDILGPAYLEKNEALIEGMVKTTVQRNRYPGIKALFEQTLALAPDAPWHPSRLAERVQAPTLLMGGALDRVAAPAEVRRLAEVLGARVEILPDAGHTIAIETPEAWRTAVTAFLDA